MAARGDGRRIGVSKVHYPLELVVLLSVATFVSIVVAVFLPSLGWNLIAYSISLWFGYYVLQVVLEKERIKAERPAHRAMVDDLVRVRLPIAQILMLFLWEAGTPADIPAMQAAARGEGDVAEILARKPLADPAPMRQLAIFNAPQMSWKQIIFTSLSSQALRLETLITRYITVADSSVLAALQGLETSHFADQIGGRIVYTDEPLTNLMLWRSLIESLVVLDKELEVALAQHADRGAATGPESYINLAIQFIEKGER